MSLNLPLAHILGAMILAIVVFAAPGVASAHGGHHPEAASTKVQSGQVPAGTAAQKSKPAQILFLAQAKLPSSDTRTCDSQNCCSGAPCSSCVAAALTDAPVNVPPVASNDIPLMHVASPGAHPPGGLRRPPRSIA